MAVETVHVKNTGLRGVTVADTKISYIDGEHGILIYRGYRIEELAARSTFMEAAFLLLNSHLPSESELERFESEPSKIGPMKYGARSGHDDCKSRVNT